MSDLREAQRLLDAAERAATTGDFATAAEQLSAAARIQEAVLGPLHPSLANTLNNLAIITERTGRPEHAEPFYRRAAGIAAASLPPDHPMVVDSRLNLEEVLSGAWHPGRPSRRPLALGAGHRARTGRLRAQRGPRAHDARAGPRGRPRHASDAVFPWRGSRRRRARHRGVRCPAVRRAEPAGFRGSRADRLGDAPAGGSSRVTLADMGGRGCGGVGRSRALRGGAPVVVARHLAAVARASSDRAAGLGVAAPRAGHGARAASSRRCSEHRGPAAGGRAD